MKKMHRHEHKQSNEPFSEGTAKTTFALPNALLSPSHRLLTGLVSMCATALLTSAWSAGFARASSIIAFFAFRPVAPSPWRSLVAINIFLLFLLFTMPLSMLSSATTTSSVLILSPGIGFRLDYFIKACIIAAKSNAIYFQFLLFLAPLPLTHTCAILCEWRVPAQFLTLMQLVVRHISSIRQEAQALYAAATLRGFTPQNSLRSYKTIAYLVAMLFIRCHDTVRRTSDAMKLRGFTGQFPLFLPHLPPPPPLSRALMGMVCTSALLLTIADRIWMP